MNNNDLIKEMEEDDKKREKECKEAEEIRKKGIKIKVNDEKYFENLDLSDCVFCMNFDDETETCKEKMPNIDPWYTKDNGLPDECEKFDYIYETDE